MIRSTLFFAIFFVGVFVVDQMIKNIFLEGFRWGSDYFSLILTYNKGVAFSMFSFLDGYLKYLQMALIFGIIVYLLLYKDIFKEYCIPAGIILGAACSNIYDRFIHEGVVDYFYWHYGFEFAIFNFADVMIDLGVVVVLWISFRKKRAIPSQ
ncbi:MAG: signal peptidase II [Sulfurospirillaceae bacterium]|nr:signal peptidase II [Sulfurospirillaceae bacterium]